MRRNCRKRFLLRLAQDGRRTGQPESVLMGRALPAIRVRMERVCGPTGIGEVRTPMEQPTLEDRVAALEQVIAQLVARPDGVIGKNWRTTLGMFDGDPVMKEIDEEGRRIREEDRRRAASG